ncbi:MAG: gliding motility lipoprotein GldH [Cytophagales bacterium]|nr:gliding motility lipoprotein GldH [Cytophagales bacterium]
MRQFRILAVLCVFACLLGSCQDETRVFERNEELPNASWKRNYHPTFEFEIQDTSLAYNILFNVRNTLEYKYSNLYINYALEDSEGKAIYENQSQVYLFDATGKPTGQKSYIFPTALADIYDHTYLCMASVKFQKQGTYKLKLKQYMRNQNPLKEIVAVGVRVENAIQK